MLFEWAAMNTFINGSNLLRNVIMRAPEKLTHFKCVPFCSTQAEERS